MDSNTYAYYKEQFDEIKEETMADNWDMNPDRAKKHRNDAKRLMRHLEAEFGYYDSHVKYFRGYMDWWLR